MDANTRTPRDLFDGNVCYEIPPFQRPYVWTEEDQWQPLWEDVERVTEALLEAGADDLKKAGIGNHFLGAVVFKQIANVAGDPDRRSVIDGQQRLTTLQFLLDAAQLVLAEYGDEDDAESVHELVANTAKRFRGTWRRFKLWPSRIDRPSFEHVMDNDLQVPQELADSRNAQAHGFFREAISEWAQVQGSPKDA